MNSHTALPFKVPESSASGEKQRSGKGHFYCVLSFVAAGGKYGDIVQVNFLSFNVGFFNMTGARSKSL